MSDITVTNWFGDLVTHPNAVAQAASVDDIVAVLKKPDQYPSPVRPIGSFHSTERCGLADGGTIVDMTGMNKILAISGDTVTVEAGAIYYRYCQGTRKTGLAVLCEHRNRQYYRRQRGLLRDEGRFHAG